VVSLESSEQRLKTCLIVSPAANRTGVDGLPDLHHAGCPYDAPGRVEVEA
jgi:hypothetical protein